MTVVAQSVCLFVTTLIIRSSSDVSVSSLPTQAVHTAFLGTALIMSPPLSLTFVPLTLIYDVSSPRIELYLWLWPSIEGELWSSKGSRLKVKMWSVVPRVRAVVVAFLFNAMLTVEYNSSNFADDCESNFVQDVSIQHNYVTSLCIA